MRAGLAGEHARIMAADGSKKVPWSPVAAEAEEVVVTPAVASEAQSEHNKAVVDAWVAFDLDGRRSGLDRQCLELKDAKEAAKRSRKMLAESTKEFGKMSDTDQTTDARQDERRRTRRASSAPRLTLTIACCMRLLVRISIQCQTPSTNMFTVNDHPSFPGQAAAIHEVSKK